MREKDWKGNRGMFRGQGIPFPQSYLLLFLLTIGEFCILQNVMKKVKENHVIIEFLFRVPLSRAGFVVTCKLEIAERITV